MTDDGIIDTKCMTKAEADEYKALRYLTFADGYLRYVVVGPSVVPVVTSTEYQEHLKGKAIRTEAPHRADPHQR